MAAILPHRYVAGGFAELQKKYGFSLTIKRGAGMVLFSI
jgi:hypothetical protein